MNNTNQQAITIAITGASGSIYGLKTIEFLLSIGQRVDLICSETACKVISLETSLQLEHNSPVQNKKAVLDYLSQKGSPSNPELLTLWSAENLAAAVSSGSYRSQGMIVTPCSMGTIGRIANGTSNDLIARCADVCLKERQKLILVARETPLSLIHLQNMLTITQAGGIILPAMPAFYHNPQTIDDLVNFVVGKTLDCFGIDNELFKRWMSKSH